MDSYSAASLCLHNNENSILGFYELRAPYMILHRSHRAGKDSCDFLTAVPGKIERFSLSFQPSNQPKSPCPHHHNFIEMMYVLSGEVCHRIEKKAYRYRSGQCCILNRNIRHCEHFSADCEVVFLMFAESFLAQLLDHDTPYTHDGSCHSYFTTIRHLLDQNHRNYYEPSKEYTDFLPLQWETLEKMLRTEWRPLIRQLIRETGAQKPGCMFMIEGILARLFSLLENPELYRKSQIRLAGSKEEMLLNKIGHIFEACHGNIGREELAILMEYNSDYLNRVVKRQTGMSLMAYGQIFCLREAERLLLETSKSIAEIVSGLGFSNRSYFYRIFEKKYGMTPKEYRRIHNIYF